MRHPPARVPRADLAPDRAAPPEPPALGVRLVYRTRGDVVHPAGTRGPPRSGARPSRGVAAVGVVLRPLLAGFVALLGRFGALAFGFISQAVILDVAVDLAPNADVHGLGEIILVSWVAAAIAAIVNWALDAGTKTTSRRTCSIGPYGWHAGGRAMARTSPSGMACSSCSSMALGKTCCAKPFQQGPHLPSPPGSGQGPTS